MKKSLVVVVVGAKKSFLGGGKYCSYRRGVVVCSDGGNIT